MLEMTEENVKAKQLCEDGICCSMGEARRLLASKRGQKIIDKKLELKNIKFGRRPMKSSVEIVWPRKEEMPS